MSILATFGHLVERNERLHPGELSLIYADKRITFAEHAVRARKLADALYRLGMRHQDRVAIVAMNCPEHLEVSGAVEVSGFIVAPVNYRLAPTETAYVINDCSPTVLVFEAQYTGVIGSIRTQLKSVRNFVCIGSDSPDWAVPYEELIATGDAGGPPIRPGAQDIISILYTSGTTGRPKGVMNTHESFMWAALLEVIEMQTDVGGKFLVVMPVYHLGGRLMVIAQHLRGGSVILHRAFDAAEVVRTIERERVTEAHLAPTMLQAVLDEPEIDRYDLSSLKSLMHAAAPISIPLRKRALEKFGPILLDGFGQTEGGGTMLRKHQQKLDGTPEEVRRLGSVGQPMLHTQLRIVDEHDRELPTGSIGEILFKSPQNMQGYWNNQAATIEALRNGWLHTGDVGYVDQEGFLFLVDRIKDMIISGGENIYSREVEEAVLSYPQVGDAAVIGIPDAQWGETVLALVVPIQGVSLDPESLIAHCKTQIASYKCPKKIDFVAELPRLPSGKVNKVELRERYAKH